MKIANREKEIESEKKATWLRENALVINKYRQMDFYIQYWAPGKKIIKGGRREANRTKLAFVRHFCHSRRGHHHRLNYDFTENIYRKLKRMNWSWWICCIYVLYCSQLIFDEWKTERMEKKGGEEQFRFRLATVRMCSHT